MIESKVCTICNEDKPLDQYYAQKKTTQSKGEYIYYPPYCKECTIKKSAKYIEEHKEEYSEYQKEWYIHNKDVNAEICKRHRENNLEHYQEYQKEWRQNNPDKLKEYNLYREMNKKHEISLYEWEECKNYFNYRCAYCNLKIEEHYIKYKGEIKLGDFHKEHVDYKGGNDLSNCVPSCKQCNTSKHDKDFIEWYRNFEKYSIECENKIVKWLDEDYKKYIIEK